MNTWIRRTRREAAALERDPSRVFHLFSIFADIPRISWLWLACAQLTGFVGAAQRSSTAEFTSGVKAGLVPQLLDYVLAQAAQPLRVIALGPVSPVWCHGSAISLSCRL